MLLSEFGLLMLSAASVAFFHTLLGPDHYLPFIVLSKANRWSKLKTFWLTLICGLGHVGSSIALGLIGIALGLALSGLEAFEDVRGNLAAWLFIAFGLAYFIWGLRQAYKNRPHTHRHFHDDGSMHEHEHTHHHDHSHLHKIKGKKLTPWVLFVIFVLGPCEPLIPIFIYPAARHNLPAVIAVTVVFSLVTILTMLMLVFMAGYGLSLLPLKTLERYMHALAGATILISGLGIQFLGL